MLVVKSIIWSVSLGSGTSGGVLAPLLMMGGALGGSRRRFLPADGPGFWPLVSMGAILGGTMRSPFTGDGLRARADARRQHAAAAAVAVASRTRFTVLVLRRSILTEKIARRGFHLSREYAIDPLEILFVREVMRSEPGGPPPLAPAICYPDETLRTVVYRMAHLGEVRLAVVDRADPSISVGEVTLQDLLIARRRHLEEETRRERPLPLPMMMTPWLRAGPK